MCPQKTINEKLNTKFNLEYEGQDEKLYKLLVMLDQKCLSLCNSGDLFRRDVMGMFKCA